jgi:SPX domain protein involved in polyphosphate accumulation
MFTATMPQDHRLQQQRFELKYLVAESLTPAIRDFVSCHLELDDFGVGRPNLSYPVHSVYLDSDDLHTHQATIVGTKNRFKLRLRYYDDAPNAPVFFEVKGRVDSCILKRRCGVRRAAVAEVLSGQVPSLEQMVTTEPRHFAALERFLLLMTSINARPKAHNSYLREAWVSPYDNSVRVTFDRHVRIEPHFDFTAVVPMRDPMPIYSPIVILELKFTNRFPNWFNDLVQSFNLMQSSAAKYSGGVLLLGESRFDEDRIFDDAPFRSNLAAGGVEHLVMAEM